MRLFDAAFFDAWTHNDGSRSFQSSLTGALAEPTRESLLVESPLQQLETEALANNSPDRRRHTVPRLLSRVGLWGAYFRGTPELIEFGESHPAGRYHVRMCDLNAPHFIRERKDRSDLRRVLTSSPAIIRDLGKGLQLSNLLNLLNSIVDRFIPPIPLATP